MQSHAPDLLQHLYRALLVNILRATLREVLDDMRGPLGVEGRGHLRPCLPELLLRRRADREPLCARGNVAEELKLHLLRFLEDPHGEVRDLSLRVAALCVALAQARVHLAQSAAVCVEDPLQRVLWHEADNVTQGVRHIGRRRAQAPPGLAPVVRRELLREVPLNKRLHGRVRVAGALHGLHIARPGVVALVGALLRLFRREALGIPALDLHEVAEDVVLLGHDLLRGLLLLLLRRAALHGGRPLFVGQALPEVVANEFLVLRGEAAYRRERDLPLRDGLQRPVDRVASTHHVDVLRIQRRTFGGAFGDVRRHQLLADGGPVVLGRIGREHRRHDTGELRALPVVEVVALPLRRQHPHPQAADTGRAAVGEHPAGVLAHTRLQPGAVLAVEKFVRIHAPPGSKVGVIVILLARALH